MPEQPTDPYLNLVSAIVVSAAKDARAGDHLALDWLAGDQCAHYCEVLDLNAEAIQRWVRLNAGKRRKYKTGPKGRISQKER